MQDILILIQHQKMLVAALVIVLILLMIVEFIRQKQGAQRLSPQMATQMINHQNALVLDIRPSEAFTTGHIVGSISLPLTELEQKLKKIEKFKSQPIVITCAGGLESPRAAAILTKHGFQVSLLAGGIRGWKEAELPLVKG